MLTPQAEHKALVRLTAPSPHCWKKQQEDHEAAQLTPLTQAALAKYKIRHSSQAQTARDYSGSCSTAGQTSRYASFKTFGNGVIQKVEADRKNRGIQTVNRTPEKGIQNHCRKIRKISE